MGNTLKKYTLNKVKEELIENKELYDFKLWMSVELQKIYDCPMESPYYYLKQIKKILDKLDK